MSILTRTRRPFSPAEDALILRMRDDGATFTAILRRLPSRTAPTLQQRFATLDRERKGLPREIPSINLIAEAHYVAAASSGSAELRDRMQRYYRSYAAAHNIPIEAAMAKLLYQRRAE